MAHSLSLPINTSGKNPQKCTERKKLCFLCTLKLANFFFECTSQIQQYNSFLLSQRQELLLLILKQTVKQTNTDDVGEQFV